MIRVQFNDKDSRYDAEFKTISKDVIQLTGDKIPKNTSGFKAYRKNGNLLGDYSEYTEVVAEVKNGFQYKKG